MEAPLFDLSTNLDRDNRLRLVGQVYHDGQALYFSQAFQGPTHYRRKFPKKLLHAGAVYPDAAPLREK